jgi:AraC-like DNA-binding protein
MSDKLIHIQSISELHEILGFDKPSHPLISIMDVSKWVVGPERVGQRFSTGLYSIGMKDASCGFEYGRNSYDFNEGVLIFTAPDQVSTVVKEQKENEINGWMLFFHPDLIRNTDLGKHIDDYGFFSYDVHEALHLSDQEQQTIQECVNMIKNEISERIDNHSQRVITSTLELLLNYSLRYYERQFNTRSAQHSDTIGAFERILKQYYTDGLLIKDGIPAVEYFANKVHLSANYLSDLLKKETGRSAKEHINHFLVEKAKTLLLSNSDSISGVAYQLGFNYPHYFSRLFKATTGLTPQEYRKKPSLN